MDIKQPVHLFGHCRTLCVQWWATQCIYPLIHQQDIIYSLQRNSSSIFVNSMPAARHIIFSTRCSHVMHASYNSFSSNQGIIITFLSRLVSNCLFSSWKGLERYQGLRARRLLHKVPTIKTTLPSLSHRIMTTMQQLTLILTWLTWIWTQTLILTQLCTCSLRSRG